MAQFFAFLRSNHYLYAVTLFLCRNFYNVYITLLPSCLGTFLHSIMLISDLIHVFSTIIQLYLKRLHTLLPEAPGLLQEGILLHTTLVLPISLTDDLLLKHPSKSCNTIIIYKILVLHFHKITKVIFKQYKYSF